MRWILTIVLAACIMGCVPADTVPGYYESICNDQGCQLVPRDGIPPVDADIVGQAEDGAFIYKRH